MSDYFTDYKNSTGVTDKEIFDMVLRDTKRDGIEDLIKYLESTDFYTAPASSRFHCDYEGGLVEHSLNVYRCMTFKQRSQLWGSIFEKNNTPDESLAISALLHDVCKANFYTVDYRNQKTYDEDKVAKAERWQIKSDNNGSFIWETVPFYKTDEQFPFGHGDKSVYIVNKYITLTDEEAVAIRFHMGAYESQNIWNSLGNAFEKYPLAMALHEADMEATHMLEVKP